jgi:hypothetical protein
MITVFVNSVVLVTAVLISELVHSSTVVVVARWFEVAEKKSDPIALDAVPRTETE